MNPSLQQTQGDFVRHIKDPANNEFDYGIEPRRMAIYRELFFNNLCGFLDSAFPVLASIYTQSQWRDLARRFYATHPCRSPYMLDISKEFVEYLNGEYQLQPSDPPFLTELAHYEWLELNVSVRKVTQPHVYWDGQQEVDKIVLSELASVVSYPFPVHQISADYQPKQQSEPNYYVVYRNEQDEVNFLLVNQVTAYMLNLVEQQGTASLSALIKQLQQAMPQLPTAQVAMGAQQSVQQLLQQQILLPA